MCPAAATARRHACGLEQLLVCLYGVGPGRLPLADLTQDEGASMELALRLFRPEDFWMTTGVAVVMD